MKPTSTDLEHQLGSQSAADLNEALLDRLEAAAYGTLTELTDEELKFEARLRAIQPYGLSHQLLAKLEAKVVGLPAPSQVHVLPFSRHRIERPSEVRKQAPWMAAAAAVTLLGVMTALWLDPMSGPSSANNSPTLPSELDRSPAPLSHSEVVPAEFTRALDQTQDEGIIWPTNDTPHRVIKATYIDRVKMKREDGSTYEVEKPRVEYYLVPTESH